MSRYDRYSDDALRVLVKTQELTLEQKKDESSPGELAEALMLSALPEIVAIANANNLFIDEQRLRLLNERINPAGADATAVGLGTAQGQNASGTATANTAAPASVGTAAGNAGKTIKLSADFRFVLDLAEKMAGKRQVEPAHLIQAGWPLIQDSIVHYFRTAAAPDLRIEAADIELPLGGAEEGHNEAEQILLRFGRELTGRDKVWPFFGRDHELDQLTATLLKFWKPNPLLIGESGVGKSALVEGLANRLDAGRVPAPLAGNRIFEIRLSELIAGTNLHGALEENLNLILQAAEALPEVILFIDEIHQIVPAFANNPISEVLKPALSSGRIRCIGATTNADYSRYLEKDSALLRRFQTVLIKEPDRPTVLRILQGLRPSLVEHYKLEIDNQLLEKTIDLAGRYLPMRRFPDKALDILDRAAARSCFAGEQALSEKKLEIAVREVANVVTDINTSQIQALPALEAKLADSIHGQEQAIAQVASAVRVAKLRLNAEDGRPDGAFLFTGPTGVGKTALAVSLARELSGRTDALFRIDMSEFSDAHTAARLLGAPPGYIGYEDSPLLTRAVQTCSGGVLLLDELEKAHPQVHRLFLQILDAGRATDSSGRVLSFAGITIIATCNVGSESMSPVGFSSESRKGDGRVPFSALKKSFPLELLNRFDAIIPFRALTRADCGHILSTMLIPASNANLFQVHGLRLDYSSSLLEAILDEGYSDEFGARHLQRAFRNLVLTPLAAVLGSQNLSGRILAERLDGATSFKPPKPGSDQAGQSAALVVQRERGSGGHSHQTS
ncbi:MAG: ATP-dependent Clp protease ATP-binding subunit [Spirochaetes bacterium]|nr:ATP-dependent Clp protease ATP-binding subunit [Spirochaetota bacterium]